MFRPMRRKRQELTKEMTEDILHRNTAGVLALAGDEEFPYAVPISYVYDGTHIYFHTAVTGHKVDALRQNPNVSFAVIDRDEIIPKNTPRHTAVSSYSDAFASSRMMQKNGRPHANSPSNMLRTTRRNSTHAKSTVHGKGSTCSK